MDYLSGSKMIPHDKTVAGDIPKSLGQVSNLTTLRLEGNRLSGISEEAARGLQRLRIPNLYLEDNPWTDPPAYVVERGFERIVGYWEAIAHSGSYVSWKLKVVLVGAVKAGKTSLANSMIHGKPRLCDEDDGTIGVEVHVNEPCKPDAEGELELIFWDFAGHCEYHSTHQVFLSRGALHLLVVDLKRFADEPRARGELVDVWLDTLQSRVPGSSVLVVATQIDRLTDNLDVPLSDLRRRVESHLSAQHSSTYLDAQQGLIFHGVETVTSARSESLLYLRLKLSTLVYTKQDNFPSLGRRCPVSWARVATMLGAKRSGKDPVLQASRVGTVEQDHLETHEAVTAGVKYLLRADAIYEWRRIVRDLKLENEVGSTLWDIGFRKLQRTRDPERSGKKAVFEDAVDQLVREGTILDSGDILYLEPTWVNELLRATLDHDLTDVTKEDFWEDEMNIFSGESNENFYHLKCIHDNFPSTGILSVRYLRFLWRNVPEICDTALFQSLINTMSSHGVIFWGKPSDPGRQEMDNALDDRAELFVPLHLPSTILESDLEDLTGFPGRFQMEAVYKIHQTYLPPGILGLLMARLLYLEYIHFEKCWSRGTIFTLDHVLVLLHLDTAPGCKEEHQITVNLFDERLFSPLDKAMDFVEHEIKSLFSGHFPGLFFRLKQGYPRYVEPLDHVGSMGKADVVNAVVTMINGLEAQIDREPVVKATPERVNIS